MFVILTIIVFTCTNKAMSTDHLYKELGQRVKERRKSIDLTQEQLSTQIGISRASIANIEAGRQLVFVHHLFAIAQVLGVDSVAMLLPLPKKGRQIEESLPLPDSGLTKKQRNDVLQLLNISPKKTGVNIAEEKIT